MNYLEIKLPCNANAIQIQTRHTLATTPVQLDSANNSIRIGSLADIVCQNFHVSQRTKTKQQNIFKYTYVLILTPSIPFFIRSIKQCELV